MIDNLLSKTCNTVYMIDNLLSKTCNTVYIVVDQSIEPYLANAGSSAQKRNLHVVIYTSLIFKIYICTGSYCPAGTEWSMQYECLAGTYKNKAQYFDLLLFNIEKTYGLGRTKIHTYEMEHQ
jgi:hypothetical protein